MTKSTGLSALVSVTATTILHDGTAWDSQSALVSVMIATTILHDGTARNSQSALVSNLTAIIILGK